MKTSLIISAHTDDCLFSIGSYVQTLENVIVVSPFAGIPTDEQGKAKHITLRREHEEACKVAGINFINGDFLDDVYKDTRDLSGLVEWLRSIITNEEDDIYVPLGISHVDHVILRDIFVKHFRIDYFYCELPYYVRYPYLAENLQMLLCTNRKLITCEKTPLKEIAVRKYISQTDEGVLNDILVQERIWL